MVLQEALERVLTVDTQQIEAIRVCEATAAGYWDPVFARLPQDLIDRAQTWAHRHGLTLSALLRAGLAIRLRDEPPPPPLSPEKAARLEKLRRSWEAIQERREVQQEGGYAKVLAKQRADRAAEEAERAKRYAEARAALLAHYRAVQS